MAKRKKNRIFPKSPWLSDDRRKLIANIYESSSARFSDLVVKADLDPLSDFQFADLSDVNFSFSDLRGFNFKGANLSNTIWTGALWDTSTIIDQADLFNAIGFEPRPAQYKHRFTRASVAQNLPYLRRYALALVGDRRQAEKLVYSTLEKLVNQPYIFDRKATDRMELYRLFQLSWRTWRMQKPSAKPRSPVDRKLQRLSIAAREAFLILYLEGFSIDEAAYILGLNVQKTFAQVDKAGQQLAAMIATDVLIMESETFISMELESLVKSLGHRVVGVARTHSQAIALAKKKQLGLILSDTQLADGGSGIEVVNEILKKSSVVTIFITAYPEHFLTQPRPEPAFLIAKPFQATTVSAVISQALFFSRTARSGLK